MGKDADFSEERLAARFNNDLANSLGNLLNRTLSMLSKYRVSVVKKDNQDLLYGREGAAYVAPFAGLITVLTNTYRAQMDGTTSAANQFDISFALGSVLEICSQCNSLIEVKAPWKLAKGPAGAETLESVLYHLAEALRVIAILISPVLPKAAQGILDQLNWKMELSGKEERFSLADVEWGQLPDGHIVGKPVPLFPRIETPL